MRKLRFIADGQILKPDPDCDFSNLVPGSEGYIQAEVSLSKEWSGYVIVAAFYSALGIEYPPQPLVDGLCTIPAEALKRRKIKMRIVGKKGYLKLQTNLVEIDQNGGGV